eukprot:TRINITY_DN2587_c0_g1_i1.p1 TRINITY_DN2587_c0_g1~~TRINITY_DN2587_c0_g1_i1.p1  ORF type:complete len:367 (+),score=68.61 TRINITY_DN2587_c0_g1_i1:68-1168(+)
MTMARQVYLERPLRITNKQVDDLEALIIRKFELKTGFGEPHQLAASLIQTFKGFDLVQNNGTVTPEAFLSVLQKLNCCSDKHIVQALFDRYDKHDKGELNLQYVCSGLVGLKKVPGSNPKCRDVMQVVTKRILERGGKNGIRTLTRIFRRMDDDGNRRLNRRELKTGMEDYGIELTSEELDTIFYFFDEDKSGDISVTELLVGIRGKMNSQRKELVQMAYTRLDKDGDQVVTAADLLRIYDTTRHPDVVSGEKTQEEVINEFAATWDKDGDAIVTEEEFLDYYKSISAGIDDDTYFELMIRNSWRIAGGKGQAANTANRRVCVTHIDGTQTIECLINDFGIGDDTDAIEAQLRKQGITDILRVSLN